MSYQHQSQKTFEEISEHIRKHLEARDWQDNPARGLAVSISLEASELLEHYQWNDSAVGSKEDLASELADIFIYAIQFAQATGIDITEAIEQKLQEAAKKYPAEQFKGKEPGAKHDAWIAAKLNYNEQKRGL